MESCYGLFLFLSSAPITSACTLLEELGEDRSVLEGGREPGCFFSYSVSGDLFRRMTLY